MVTSNDLKGIMAMMPAFTTKDGDRIDATDTVDTDELTRTVDKLIRDGGVNVLTTTGSFGEFHTLLWDEHKKLIEATVAANKKRVPLFIGCTNLNPREAIRQAKFAQDAGADGVLLGVPFYYQASVDNAVQFYHDVADALPKMGVMIYHNPTHHRVTIPVSAFKKLTDKPNIVGMKDSHRTPLQFVELCNITKGKMSIFVNQTQMFPYYQLGAAGCWSFNVWMGPSPVVALRDACMAQDWETAKRICLDLDATNKVGPNIGNSVARERV
jgi:dihydrodipicolinate synthase/N-acetylneuraminate lyase